jgi:hypothetical protein
MSDFSGLFLQLEEAAEFVPIAVKKYAAYIKSVYRDDPDFTYEVRMEMVQEYHALVLIRIGYLIDSQRGNREFGT